MPSVFRFKDFELDCGSCELRKRGRTLPVQQQPFQLLHAVLRKRGPEVSVECKVLFYFLGERRAMSCEQT